MILKKFLLLFISLPFLIAHSYAQNCTGDSVVVTKVFQFTPGESYHIEIDTFQIATGVNKHYYRNIQPSSGNVYTSSSTGIFTRTYIERNSLNDTTEFYSYSGTGTGYDYNEKIIFNYDTATNAINSRMDYHGNGNTWELYEQENWNYSPNNKLISYSILKDTIGTGSLLNTSRILYNYTGEQLNEIIIQNGNITSWVDSLRYIISYKPSGIRDSLAVHEWDNLNSIWVAGAKYNYDAANNFYVTIPSVRLIFDSSQSRYFTDSSSIVLDTLNQVKNFFHLFDREEISQNFSYDYIHGRQCKIFSSTYDWGCFNEQNIYYDSNGVSIGYYGPSACFIQYEHSYSIYYDSTYKPLSYGTSLVGGCCGTNYNYTYYYSNDSTIFLEYLTMDELYYTRCIGSRTNTTAIVTGGCGPYHFQWSPSVGLNSDTVREPEIHLTDTITYHITVTDSLGRSASATFFTGPSVIASITDTMYCSSCPAQLAANYYSTIGPITPSYQWFRNDSVIAGATSQNYTPTNSGEYTVAISYSLHGNCTSTSAAYYFLVNDIQDQELTKLVLYPNPASDHTQINNLLRNSEIKIYDLAGRSVLLEGSWSSSRDQFIINTSHLSNSIYFIDVEVKGQHKRMKLIVDR